jgi:heme-degrading monooxygenase HmoA
VAIIEMQRFALRPGVSEAAFRVADAEAQTAFAYQQPGLVRRTTARDSETANWVVVTLWSDAESADTAASKAAGNPAMAQLHAMMDQARPTERYETLPG